MKYSVTHRTYCTATAIPFIYSFSGNCTPQPQFPHSCPRIGPHNSSSRKGRPIVEISNSLTDTWMWDWGPDIPFLGIFVSNFRHFVFAVCISWEPTMVCEIHLRSLPSERSVCLENRLVTYRTYCISREPTIVCEIYLRSLLQNVLENQLVCEIHLRSSLQNVPYILRTMVCEICLWICFTSCLWDFPLYVLNSLQVISLRPPPATIFYR